MQETRAAKLRAAIRHRQAVSPRERAAHQSILQTILRDLPQHQHQALLRYYRDGITIDQAADEASMGVEAFRELKRNVRAQFFKATDAAASAFAGGIAAGGEDGTRAE